MTSSLTRPARPDRPARHDRPLAEGPSGVGRLLAGIVPNSTSALELLRWHRLDRRSPGNGGNPPLKPGRQLHTLRQI